jgi:hypothetical protein
MATTAPHSPVWVINGRNPTSRQWSAFGGKAEVSYHAAERLQLAKRRLLDTLRQVQSRVLEQL